MRIRQYVMRYTDTLQCICKGLENNIELSKPSNRPSQNPPPKNHSNQQPSKPPTLTQPNLPKPHPSPPSIINNILQPRRRKKRHQRRRCRKNRILPYLPEHLFRSRTTPLVKTGTRIIGYDEFPDCHALIAGCVADGGSVYETGGTELPFVAGGALEAGEGVGGMVWGGS